MRKDTPTAGHMEKWPVEIGSNTFRGCGLSHAWCTVEEQNETLACYELAWSVEDSKRLNPDLFRGLYLSGRFCTWLMPYHGSVVLSKISRGPRALQEVPVVEKTCLEFRFRLSHHLQTLAS